jgi:hypothetical protein
MAKLKRNFLRGRMNKDLDERLVPNGEYRDALNIQVSTSEGSDVGAIENLLGNTKKNAKSNGGFWDPAFGLNNTKCIGVVRDGQNNKIYWFITSETVDAILEYDQAFGTVEPVLVDKNSVLGFDPDYLITGVNILEGLLYWTDNLNEPKVINIATFKAGSFQGANTDLSVHTQVYGRNFIEKDITVITETPPIAPRARAFASVVGGPGTGITPITTNSSSAFYQAESGDTIVVNWTNSGAGVNWPANSRVAITTEVEQEDGTIDKYQVIGEFVFLVPNAVGGSLLVESATPDIPDLLLEWEMLLIEDDPIFKDDFPRFSYRYKFTDGRYSTYAPFSDVAFVPGEFKYLSRDGNNEGMNSAIRKIIVDNLPTVPSNVLEVEILYKGARSNNIYVIETFEAANVGALDITSGVLGPVIESVQLLRLYDNVPRLAKSQEIVGNRIIYGNYLQNYDVTASSVSVTATEYSVAHSNVGFGLASVKTNREYQVGISFLDDYGRESPVFTSNDGAVTFSGKNANNQNSIEATLLATSVPSWAEYFKFYIKNNTPEYYNLALDRYYDAGDGSVWLSFPSSERNKVTEGQFITLKKEHDSSKPVLINNKYKILAVENEAPTYLTEIDELIANEGALALTFTTGNKRVRFAGPEETTNEAFYNGFKKGETLYFTSNGGTTKTAIYEIAKGGPTGATYTDSNSVTWAEYIVYLTEGIRTEDAWLDILPNEEPLVVSLNEKKAKNSPEFQGRFFAKITPNATFTDAIPSDFKYGTVRYVLDVTKSVDDFAVLPTVTDLNWYDNLSLNLLPTSGSGTPIYGAVNGESTINVFYTGVSAGTSAQNAWDKITKVGTRIKFVQSNGSVSNNFYVVLKTEDSAGTYGGSNSYIRTDVSGNQYGPGLWVKITLDRPYNDTADSNPTALQIFREADEITDTLLSSTNPAVFETEPEELADLDIYWEASDKIETSRFDITRILSWYNCYSFGNGAESDRIRDDFNAPIIGKGVRVNAELQEPYKQERRASGLIYGGLYNSLSSVNNTNQFITGIKITKDLDPQYGGIQKLHSRDTNLVAFAEDKVFRILADKDALYNADGNVNLTSTNRVLGDASTFAGEFGICKNPESFATYGFRSYFADKSRGAVLRLSADGITEISEKGMSDYFIDKFRTVSTSLIGSFDEDTSSYNLVVGGESVSFKEKVDGWPTRLSYIPEFGTSLNNEYYTFNNGELYEHSNATRNNFYGVQSESSVEMIFNDAPSSIKNFKTLAYEGSDRWTAVVNTDKQSGEVNNWRDNEGLYFNFIKGAEATWDNATQTGTLNSKEFSVQGIGTITAVAGGAPYEFEVGGNVNASLSIGDTLFIKRPVGIFKVGDVVTASNNKITVNDPNNIVPAVSEYAFFAKSNEINISGLLGYYGSVTLTNAAVTKSELFGVSSEAFISSE